jgi:transketolase
VVFVGFSVAWVIVADAWPDPRQVDLSARRREALTNRDRSEGADILDGAKTSPTAARRVVATARTPASGSGAAQQRMSSPSEHPIDELCIDTIRTLSMDAVQQANSGHPGTPMAMAPVIYMLWQNFLRFDPKDPIWPNRDRFVLSVGHASMLLYAILHLTGVKAADAANGKPEVLLIGTGSEVALCIDAYEALKKSGVAARVSVEEGSVLGWDRYVGMSGAKIGMHTFGSSAPLKDLQTKFGFTPDKVLATAKEQIAKTGGKTT